VPKNVKKSRGKLAEGQDFMITGKIDTTSLCVTQPMTGTCYNHPKSGVEPEDDDQHIRIYNICERDGARKRFRGGRIDR
jgi:hypothetical protein